MQEADLRTDTEERANFPHFPPRTTWEFVCLSFRVKFEMFRWIAQAFAPFVIMFYFLPDRLLAAFVGIGFVTISTTFPPRDVSMFCPRPTLGAVTSIASATFFVAMHSLTCGLALALIAIQCGTVPPWHLVSALVGMVVYAMLACGLETPVRRSFRLPPPTGEGDPAAYFENEDG